MKTHLKHRKNLDPIGYCIYVIYAAAIMFLLMSTISHGDELETYIVKTAKREGVDPALALAIAQVESKMNPNAIGSLGELGIFQLRPEYHAVVRGDAERNIGVAIKYLAQLKKQCGRYGDAYFVCFNYGPARTLKHPRQFPYYVRVMEVLHRNRDESRRFIASAH